MNTLLRLEGWCCGDITDPVVSGGLCRTGPRCDSGPQLAACGVANTSDCEACNAFRVMGSFTLLPVACGAGSSCPGFMRWRWGAFFEL